MTDKGSQIYKDIVFPTAMNLSPIFKKISNIFSETLLSIKIVFIELKKILILVIKISISIYLIAIVKSIKLKIENKINIANKFCYP